MKSYHPTTPSRRSMTTISYKKKLSGKKEKSLISGFRRGSGRNAFGRITTRHKGGGHKRKYRHVSFMFDKLNVPGKIERLEYDPNRSGFIALVVYHDGEKRYVLASKSFEPGAGIITSEKAPLIPGNALHIGNIPVGTFVYNIEVKPRGGAKLCRSAGNFAEVVAHDKDYTQVKLPSSEIRKIHKTAFAVIGEVSNDEHHLRVLEKAGRSRWLGIRPTVRGSAMNPVDHPHGGGEGKSGRGRRRAKSAWGKLTGKRQKSRTPKKYSNRLIVSRRRVGKQRKSS